ncbi:hypothetical protein D7U89_10700 [Stenotrophomonas maltophilia]|uniref:hypothetical protein n=1 Tax=Stenotrophomonas TaxID=40323 RepID=UPI0013129783|nr:MULTISPECIES: hypothetical protein [Stenotrophomonas]MBA0225951.1 hypothetical protein [Stenotrophomonas maltophilia]MBA0366925.1 hypothetical protein [Stenotrophomonas maltophilia]MBA0402647.1 hypothetical protein [Stenotrophomonas maltophilia]MDQ7271355.1 hypothetical protein [Stenotrophomonas sp. Sm3212]
MENDQVLKTSLEPKPGKQNTVNNPNGRDVDVTIHFNSGSSVTFLLPANGSFSLVSEGDVTDINMVVRPPLTGPTAID